MVGQTFGEAISRRDPLGTFGTSLTTQANTRVKLYAKEIQK
jgi:hypothetical protein